MLYIPNIPMYIQFINEHGYINQTVNSIIIICYSLMLSEIASKLQLCNLSNKCKF